MVDCIIENLPTFSAEETDMVSNLLVYCFDMEKAISGKTLLCSTFNSMNLKYRNILPSWSQD